MSPRQIFTNLLIGVVGLADEEAHAAGHVRRCAAHNRIFEAVKSVASQGEKSVRRGN